MNDSVLPHLNAALNAVSFVLLLAGFYFIRRRRVRAHITSMSAALAVSVLFLVSYVTYHYSYGSVKFTGTGFVRPVYFTILITHIILAAVIVPLVVVTLRLALRGEYARHRRVARWTYPIWLYVSVTGVVVYLMLYRLYPSG
jgi:putative membrane protein